MKSTLDSEFSAEDERLAGGEIERRNTPARTSYGSVFDMCLVLSVVFCVLELAVQLLRTETGLQVVTLVLAVTIWAATAVSIEIIRLSTARRLELLCAAALVCDVLLLVSRLTSTSVGFSMYVVDCSTKCALVMLIMHTGGESGKPRPGSTCRAHE